MPQKMVVFMFSLEYLDVEENQAGGCYDYLTISFDEGYVQRK